MTKNVKGLTINQLLLYNGFVDHKTFSSYLLYKIQEFERERGRRITLEEFAEYLEVSRPSVSHWLNGSIPSLENAFALANKLGPQVYYYLGLDLDHDLIYLNQTWPLLNSEVRQSIRETAEKYLARKSDGQETVDRPTGADDLEKG